MTRKKSRVNNQVEQRDEKTKTKKTTRKSFQELLDLIVKTPIKIILIVVLAYLSFRIIYLNFNNKYYIEESVVPQQLINKGLDGKFVQQTILEDINEIISKSQYTSGKTGANIESENKDDFKIEYEGFNFDNVISKLLFFKNSVQTSIYFSHSNKINIDYSINKSKTQSFYFDNDSLNEDQQIQLITYQCAINILREISPLTVAYYEYQQKDFINSLYDINSIIENPSKDYDRYKVFYLKGQILEQRGNNEGAAYFFNQGLENKPDDFYLYLNIAFVYFNEKGKLPDSKKQIDKAKGWIGSDRIKLASFNNALGAYYSSQRLFSKAIPFFDYARRLDSMPNDYAINLGAIYANLRRYDSAKYYLDWGYKKDYSRLFYDSGLSTGTGGNDSIEKTNLSSALKANSFKYGPYALSLHQVNMGHQKKAELYLLNCIRLDSMFAPAYFQLGLIYRDYKDYDKSNRMLEKANNIVSFNEDIYSTSINNYIEQGDYERAIQECEEILDQDPLNSKIYRLKAKIYSLQQKKLKIAEYYYNFSLLINPNDINCLEDYCDFKKTLLDHHSVISLSNRILALLPSNIDALANIAQASSYLGYDDITSSISKKLIPDKYNNSLGYTLAARAADRRGDYSNAFKNYKEAANLHPESESINFLVNFYIKKKNYRIAIYWINRFKEIEPITYKNYLSLGQMYLMCNEFKDATIAFKTAYNLSLNNCTILKYWFTALKSNHENPLNDPEFFTAMKFSKCNMTQWIKTFGGNYYNTK